MSGMFGFTFGETILSVIVLVLIIGIIMSTKLWMNLVKEQGNAIRIQGRALGEILDLDAYFETRLEEAKEAIDKKAEEGRKKINEKLEQSKRELREENEKFLQEHLSFGRGAK